MFKPFVKLALLVTVYLILESLGVHLPNSLYAIAYRLMTRTSQPKNIKVREKT